jgi:predicted ATPase
MAAELAMHFVQGREAQKAEYYLRLAGENALRLSAYQEALSHLQQGLAMLQTLPETPEQAQHELSLRMALGPALRRKPASSRPLRWCASSRPNRWSCGWR